MPGEHDVLNDDGKQFLERYGKGSKGSDRYSLDIKTEEFGDYKQDPLPNP